jgi:hypothetical protein
VKSIAAACAALCVVPAACQPPPSHRFEEPEVCLSRGTADRLSTHFAAIGDYGYDGPYATRVAELVDSFDPDFVITLGDNNYATGSAEWIDRNIGKRYHHYIAPYVGHFGTGATENRFFPSLGNHDWLTPGAQPYLDYFVLPGNERYYDVVRGDVHLFALDSDFHEPDGITHDSVQGQWLRGALAASKARWRIVYMHHPPFSSGPHGPTPEMQWPFRDWGASLVLAGHDHTYERLFVDGMTYVVCGISGPMERYPITITLPGSVAHAIEYGALLIDADESRLRVRFYTIGSCTPTDEVELTSP